MIKLINLEKWKDAVYHAKSVEYLSKLANKMKGNSFKYNPDPNQEWKRTLSPTSNINSEHPDGPNAIWVG